VEHFGSICSVMTAARKQAVKELEALLDSSTGTNWVFTWL